MGWGVHSQVWKAGRVHQAANAIPGCSEGRLQCWEGTQVAGLSAAEVQSFTIPVLCWGARGGCRRGYAYPGLPSGRPGGTTPSALRRERGSALTPGWGWRGWQPKKEAQHFTVSKTPGCRAASSGAWFRVEGSDACEVVCKRPAL